MLGSARLILRFVPSRRIKPPLLNEVVYGIEHVAPVLRPVRQHVDLVRVALVCEGMGCKGACEVDRGPCSALGLQQGEAQLQTLSNASKTPYCNRRYQARAKYLPTNILL